MVITEPNLCAQVAGEEQGCGRGWLQSRRGSSGTSPSHSQLSCIWLMPLLREGQVSANTALIRRRQLQQPATSSQEPAQLPKHLLIWFLMAQSKLGDLASTPPALTLTSGSPL